jgi:tRNA pseudouridine38/39 synthase
MKRLEQLSHTELLKEAQRLQRLVTAHSIDRPFKHVRSVKPMDWTKYHTRRIALKVAYLGWNYHGLASQEEDTVETIESHLFRALTTCHLIQDRTSCEFSRCGRTDRGVSAFGQIFGLRVRSKALVKDGDTLESALDDEELPYVILLNRLLPLDIRVLSWSPVDDNFDARFSCLFRRYKYYFPANGLNLDAMNQAAQFYIGEHDFSNFCKIDVSKESERYERTVMEADVSYLNESFAVFHVKGKAFLWHQVRCMMAVLLLVGQGLETPNIVLSLLKDYPEGQGRPNYTMADDFPLVLVECGYDDSLFHWKTSQQQQEKILQELMQQWRRHATGTCYFEQLIHTIGSMPHGWNAPKKYIPLLQRNKCDSVQERKRKSALALENSQTNRKMK